MCTLTLFNHFKLNDKKERVQGGLVQNDTYHRHRQENNKTNRIVEEIHLRLHTVYHLEGRTRHQQREERDRNLGETEVRKEVVKHEL